MMKGKEPLFAPVHDSAGKLVEIGDIIECPELRPTKEYPSPHAEQYHACFDAGDGSVEIRDLGNNNVYMYDMNGPFYVIGKYWQHLDKLTDEDLDDYWHTTRVEAEKLNVKR